jgi:hypothetical protein
MPSDEYGIPKLPPRWRSSSTARRLARRLCELVLDADEPRQAASQRRRPAYQPGGARLSAGLRRKGHHAPSSS